MTKILTRFRSKEKQDIYDLAMSSPDKLTGGHLNAYRRGLWHPEKKWPRTWNDYPLWCAGRDTHILSRIMRRERTYMVRHDDGSTAYDLGYMSFAKACATVKRMIGERR